MYVRFAETDVTEIMIKGTTFVNLQTPTEVHSITQFFVYGTLQQGQEREAQWPVEPLAICPAWTRGTLFHRRDYPALLPGTDRVLGELWRFAPVNLPTVLRRLDRIEGAGQPGEPDLYHRVTVMVYSPESRPLGQAFTYHYARTPAEDGFTPLRPTQAKQPIRWPPE